jgi:shikimate kinase
MTDDPSTAPSPPRNIVVIGCMGVGKSSVGRCLARLANWRFADTDDLIQEQAGATIPEIFAQLGQDKFRELEHSALSSLLGSEKTIISTGGGIVTRPENVPLHRQLGLVVWLRAEEQAIVDRISRNNDRPLLRTENPRETLRALLAERLHLYAGLAQATVETTWLGQYDVASAILNTYRRRHGQI